ncbi:putative quinol monooxygenase [Sphingopyxis sp.]|jgi:quinol monooxygenase YgiN|uniref:putative quinol monooxygenase n=1 Tax=Sphingopyxis sp. TaxID=1908224 RepID=UPI002E024405|nr:putative quinol monooxygenase [Sphingopyxis sp.]
MHSNSVIMQVQIVAKEGRDGEVRDILARVAEASRAEEGCEIYQLMEHPKQTGRFSLLERWRDAATFERHQRSPHLNEGLSSLGALLAAPPSFEPWRALE